MKTTTLHISLSETLKQYVMERVVEGHFSNPSDYIRVLIREDKQRREDKKLEQRLFNGRVNNDASTTLAEVTTDHYRP